MASQRDPNRHSVMCHASLDTVAKVMTVIEGRKVAVKGAMNKRQPKCKRPMALSDYFIDCVERAVKDVKPSRKALAWKKAQYEKNVSVRTERKAKMDTESEKTRQNRIHMRTYFRKRVEKEEAALSELKARKASAKDIRAKQSLVENLRKSYAAYEEACREYSDRRHRDEDAE